MCVVSMVGDHYRDQWAPKPWYPPVNIKPLQAPEIDRREFEDLKRQVEEMKELLKRAKKYDEDNNEPDCEIDDKMEVLRRVADMVGVDLDEIIPRSH